MGVYLAVLTIVGAFALVALMLPPKYASLLAFGPYLLLLLFIGFRQEIGTDWPLYTLYFSTYTNLSFPEAWIAAPTEPLYALLNFVVGHTTGNFHLVLLVCAAAFLWGIYRLAVYFNVDPTSALFSVCPYFGFVAAMGYVRQSAAVGFAMVAVTELQRKRMARFYVMAGAATLFHYSAGAYLLIMWASNRKRLLGAAGLVGIVLILARNTSTVERFDTYTNGEAIPATGVWFRLLILSFGFVVAWTQRERWKQKAADYSFLQRNTVLLLAGMLFAVPASVVVDRFGVYLFPAYVIALSKSVEYTPPARRWMTVGLIGLHAYTVMIFWFSTSAYAPAFWVPYHAALR